MTTELLTPMIRKQNGSVELAIVVAMTALAIVLAIGGFAGWSIGGIIAGIAYVLR